MSHATFSSNPNCTSLVDGVAGAGGGLAGGVGGDAGTNAADAAAAVLNAAQNSPILIAFSVSGDEDHTHVGHSLSRFPQDIANPTAHDNLVVALIGNDLAIYDVIKVILVFRQ